MEKTTRVSGWVIFLTPPGILRVAGSSVLSSRTVSLRVAVSGQLRESRAVMDAQSYGVLFRIVFNFQFRFSCSFFFYFHRFLRILSCSFNFFFSSFYFFWHFDLLVCVILLFKKRTDSHGCSYYSSCKF